MELFGLSLPLHFGGGTQLFSNDTMQDLFKNGASLLHRQLLPSEQAIESWKEFYEMNTGQVLLLLRLFDKKGKVEMLHFIFHLKRFL